MKNKKLENLLWVIFTFVGMIFLVIGIFFCTNLFNMKNKVKTQGVITKINLDRYDNKNSNYDVYVSYYVNGSEYTSKLNGYSSSFYEGKEIEIYYYINNPTKIGTISLDLVFLIFPGIGLIFTFIGVIGLVVIRSKDKNIKWLKQNGKLIYANYLESTVNKNYSVNGKYPYNIICEWNNLEDNKRYLFKSRNIWINPENIIREKNITMLPVYIDLNNVKRYFVDTDEITADVVDLR